MAFYLGLFAIMIIFMLLGRVTMSSVWAWLGVIMLALVAGLRYETGNDFLPYKTIYAGDYSAGQVELDFCFYEIFLTDCMPLFGFFYWHGQQ